MTIGCRDSYVDSPPFTFGVPLEDIFPNNGIHPIIEDLLQVAYETAIHCDFSLETILSRMQGPLKYRLTVKQLFLKRKNLSNIVLEWPGSIFWLIRHFLGLLPLPLIPTYADGCKFNWSELSVRCKPYITLKENGSSKYLLHRAAREISKLPHANYFFLKRLVKFFRKLITCPYYSGQHLRKSTAIIIVKFFSSALFLRPFRPGHSSSMIDRQYQTLLLYFIIKWPLIDKYCSTYRSEKNYSKLHQIPEVSTPLESLQFLETDKIDEKEVTEEINFKNKSVESYTQTSLNKRDELDLNAPIIRLIPYIYYYDSDKYLKDFSCQTDSDSGFYFEYTEKHNEMDVACQATKYDSSNASDKEALYAKYDDIDSEYEKHSHSRNSDLVLGSFQTLDNEKMNQKTFRRKSKAEYKACSPPSIDCLEEDVILQDYKKREKEKGVYGWVYSISSDLSDDPNMATVDISDSDGYIFDEYNNFQFDSCKSSQNLISPMKPSKESGNNIINRISKIGWTYSPNQTKEKYQSLKTPQDSKNNYKICFEEAQTNKEEDSKVSLENIENAPCSTEINMIKTSSKKRMSLTNIGNRVSSKFDLMKLFTNAKRKSLDNSASADEISSKIRYKKIQSAKSSLF